MTGERLISRRELGRATLARQLLLERAQLEPLAAVERLAGLHAQEPRPPFLALWSRLAGFGDERLLAELRRGRIVRGPLFRATLHLVSARDWATFRPALAPALARAFAGLGARAKAIDTAAVAAAARELLADGPLTAEELREGLSAAFPEQEDVRALGYAARMHVPLTLVPGDDRHGFPREAQLALAEPGEPDGAGEELVRRYLAAHGPAAVADAQEWSGLSGLAATFDSLRGELERFVDERGRELFDIPGAPRPPAHTPAPARLLGEFDAVMLAHADRSRLIADEHRPRLTTKNLRVNAVALHDGEACATWRVRRTARAATLELTPFRPLPGAALEELEAEAMALLAASEDGSARHSFTTRPAP